jgi:hypothetical protein
MPAADKQSKPNASKPLTPALSSNFRNVKSPLTPRVAGSPTPSPTVSSARQPFVRAKSPAKPDQSATPLGGNITPRSAARKSRAGTESPLAPSQPRVPPYGPRSRASSGNESQKPEASQTPGLGITSPRFNASVPLLTVHRRTSAARSHVEGSKDVSSKFFRADEAKSAIGSPGVEEIQRLPPKPGQFFVGTSSVPSARDEKSDKREPDEKFFRANDIAQSTAPKRPVVPHIPTDRLLYGSTTSPKPLSQSTPPQSPTKNTNATVPYPTSPRKYEPTRTTSPAQMRTSIERPRSIGSGVSISEFTTQSHRKSMSASSIASATPRKLSGPRGQAQQPLELRPTQSLSPRVVASSLVSPDTLSPRSISLASTNTIPTSITSDTDISESAMLSHPVSATPSEQKLDQAAIPSTPQVDHASNARRERKVLDLEISNSSLLAINRTLERELRKQSTELRRYRRLSRSGRLSLAPSTRTVSEQSAFSLDTVTEMDGDEQRLSDFEGDSDLDDLEDEDESLASTESGSITSPSARSRQRARDEKRLMQDLSRHQQLLLDSQKLSQSIRRCMTCTDELIREGNKALEYRVGIGDVKLGGRVLNDDELDELGLINGVPEPEARQGLLSPSICKANLDEAQIWAEVDGTNHVETDTQQAEGPIQATGIASLDELTDLLESVTAELIAT